jgi:hypothetical protein
MADADESPEPRNQDDEDEAEEDEAGQQGAEEIEQSGNAGHVAQGEEHDQVQAEHRDNDKNDNNENNDDEEEGEDKDAPREPIDLTVRLVDAAGEVAGLPLSRFSFLQPQLEVELDKAIFGDPERESEPVFQSFAFPLAWFLEVNPALDLSQIQRLEFVFDRTEKGVVIIDSIGFRAPPEGG